MTFRDKKLRNDTLPKFEKKKKNFVKKKNIPNIELSSLFLTA